MSKMNKYVYLVTMPVKFVYYDCDGCADSYDVDFINNPAGKYEEETLNCFSDIYGQGLYRQSGRFKRIEKIKRLIDLYGYKLIEGTSNRLYIEKENNTLCLEIVIETNAQGSHLAVILEAIDLDIEEGEREFGLWVSGCNIKCLRWQGINPENLVECEHIRSKRLEIMKDKDGTIVEVRECSKCRQLFKRVVH